MWQSAFRAVSGANFLINRYAALKHRLLTGCESKGGRTTIMTVVSTSPSTGSKLLPTIRVLVVVKKKKEIYIEDDNLRHRLL